jgi:hypothetical protein
MTVTNDTPPVISGTYRRGQTLSTTPGEWLFDEDYLTYLYQWMRCDAAGANCVDIPGATNSSYLLTSADVGARLVSEVTATEHTDTAGLVLDEISDFQGWGHLHLDKISEISTPHGPGFRFLCDFPSGSGDGVQLVDVDHLVDRDAYLGTVSRFVGRFMFPSADNPNGFPSYGDWNALWEYGPGHTWNNQLGVDGGANRLYVRSYKAGASASRQKALGPAVVYDHWYSFDWAVKWSEGGDGYVNCVIDGTTIADWTGPTQPPGNEAPWIQFGFYSGNVIHNVVEWAALRQL